MRFQSLGLVLVGLVAGVVVGTWGSGSGLLSGGPNVAAAHSVAAADPGNELPFHLNDCVQSDCAQDPPHNIGDVGNCSSCLNADSTHSDPLSNMTVNSGGTLDGSVILSLAPSPLGIHRGRHPRPMAVPASCTQTGYVGCITITIPEMKDNFSPRQQTLWVPVPTTAHRKDYVITTCALPSNQTHLSPCPY